MAKKVEILTKEDNNDKTSFQLIINDLKINLDKDDMRALLYALDMNDIVTALHVTMALDLIRGGDYE